MSESLTYNTYFGEFLLVGATAQWVNGQFIQGFTTRSRTISSTGVPGSS